MCVPTTPAQIYHLLRRQVIRPLRKPLIVLTPKSLLRHKLAVSTTEDLAEGSFQTVIPEIDTLDPAKVTRLVLCSGKVYYDLLEKRRAEGREDIAIVRLEQLYPFPEDDLMETIAPYTNLQHVVWCQEEPMNRGARTAVNTTCVAAWATTNVNSFSSTPVVMLLPLRRVVTLRCTPSSRKNCCKMPSLFNAFAH